MAFQRSQFAGRLIANDPVSDGMDFFARIQQARMNEVERERALANMVLMKSREQREAEMHPLEMDARRGQMDYLKAQMSQMARSADRQEQEADRKLSEDRFRAMGGLAKMWDRQPTAAGAMAQQWGLRGQEYRDPGNIGPDDPMPPSFDQRRMLRFTDEKSGQTFDIDPEEDRRYDQARALDFRQRMSGKDIPEHLRPFVGTVSESIASGAVKEGEELRELERLYDSKAQNDARMAAANRMRAAGAGRGGAADGRDRDDIRADMGQYLSNAGYKLKGQETKKLEEMLTLAESGNIFADAALMGQFVKFAQGGTGVLTDQDIKTFWNNVGSVPDRAEDWLSRFLSGEISGDRRQKVIQAVRVLASKGRARLDDIYSGAADLVGEKYPEDAERYLKAYFGRGLPVRRGGKTEFAPAAAQAKEKARNRDLGDKLRGKTGAPVDQDDPLYRELGF